MSKGKYREIHNFFGVNGKREKKVRGKKSGEIIDTKITRKSTFTDSSRFMPNSLSTLVDNLADELYKSKCEYCIDKCSWCLAEHWKMKYTDSKCYLAYVIVKSKILNFNCLRCNKNHKKISNEDLIYTYKFCYIDINQIILMI